MLMIFNENLLLVILFVLLVGLLIVGLFGNVVGCKGVYWIMIFGVLIVFFLLVKVFFDVMGGVSFNVIVYEWMNVGLLKFEVGFFVDLLIVMMMVVVIFVLLMVYVYMIGYMVEEDGY